MMSKKILIIYLIISLINLTTGCYYFSSVSVPEYKKIEENEGKPEEIYVKTNDGMWYHFTNYHYTIKKDTLYGLGSVLMNDWQSAENQVIALADIESMGVEDMNYVTTSILWFIAIGGVIVSIVCFWWLFFAEKEISP